MSENVRKPSEIISKYHTHMSDYYLTPNAHTTSILKTNDGLSDTTRFIYPTHHNDILTLVYGRDQCINTLKLQGSESRRHNVNQAYKT